MATETGWVRKVCDGTSEHCVKVAFVKDDDPKAAAIWHERKHVTKDGELMTYTFCDACNQEWQKLAQKQDNIVNDFIRK